MEAHDFWNLAGLAGRWGDEFQGNIICIDPEDHDAWPGGVPTRKRYSIKRESDAVMELGDSLVNYLDRRSDNNFADSADAERLEQVGAYLLATHLRLGSLSEAGFAKRHAPEIVARLNESIAAIAAKIEIGSEVVGRHPGISALGLQNLRSLSRL